MAFRRKVEIEPENGAIKIRVTDPDTAEQGRWEYYKFVSIKSVVGSQVLDMGERLPTNIRKNPIHHTDQLEFIISFHDENESSPIRYSIIDVTNQPTWTHDAAGLALALEDINRWITSGSGGGDNSDIIAIITGNTETFSIVEDDAGGADNDTNSGAKSVSIRFEGSGGAVEGVNVDSGYVLNVDASFGNMVSVISYTVPDVDDENFEFSPRVVITYIS